MSSGNDCSVEQKLSGNGSGLNGGCCYNIAEAQAINEELREIQRSLSSGEKERMELMQSLVKLKDDLTRLQLCNESSPDASTLSIPPVSNTASQTDLSGEVNRIKILITHCNTRMCASACTLIGL